MNKLPPQIQYLINIMFPLGQSVTTIANILDCRFVDLPEINFDDKKTILSKKNALSRTLKNCFPRNFPLTDEHKAKILSLKAFAIDLNNCKKADGFEHMKKDLLHPHLTYKKLYSLQLELHIGSAFIKRKKKIRFLDHIVSGKSPDLEVTIKDEKKYFECASVTPGSNPITRKTITKKIQKIIEEKNKKFTYKNPGITVIDCSWISALGKFDSEFMNLLKENLKCFLNKGLYKKTESVVLAIRYFEFGTNYPTTSYLVVNKDKSSWENKFSFYEEYKNIKETILLTKLGI